MNKLFTLLAVLFIILFSGSTYSQLNGTYTIPGSYATIAAAVTALNTVGVSGPVTFNVAAGHTETSANITFTNITPNSTNTVTFQKSGAGANPLITAAAGTSTTVDGIIKFGGTDYVTFDGIDVTDPVTNITTTTKMEWGYAVLKASGTDASQNIIIKNCVINVNTHTTIYTNTTGIYTGNHTPTSTTSLTVTVVAGAVSNCSFFSNTINTAYIGIQLNGFAAASPYTLYDQNNDIGVGGANTINSFGGSTSTAYGIYAIYQNNIEVANNILTGGSHGAFNHTTTLYGIFMSTGVNSNVDLYSNTVTLTNNTTTSTSYGVANSMGATGTTNTVNMYSNTVQNCSFPAVTSGSFYAIYQTVGCFTMNIHNNTIQNNSLGTGATTATGTLAGIYTFGGTASNGTWQVYNNTITNHSRLQSVVGTGTNYGIYTSATGTTYNVTGNTIQNCNWNSTSTSYVIYNSNSVPTTLNISTNTINNIQRLNNSGGTTYGIYCANSNAAGTNTFSTNTVNNINSYPTSTTTYGTGSNYGMFISTSSTATVQCNNNTVDSLRLNGSGTTYGIYNSTSGTANVYNNTISNLINTHTGQILGNYLLPGATGVVNSYQNTLHSFYNDSNAIFGIYSGTGLTNNIYKNNLYNFQSSGAGGSFYGICTGSSTAGATTNVYNNFCSDMRATAASFFLSAGLYLFGTTANTHNYYYNTVFLNGTSTAASQVDGVYANTGPTFDFRNNIIVNNSNSAAGVNIGMQRSSTTIGTYSTTSDNNCFYIGGTSTAWYYFDGTNTATTMSAYRTLVSPREGSSVNENAPFVNTSSTPYDLRLTSCASSQCESGGQIISSPSITTDYDGEARYNNSGFPNCSTFTATNPDIGADEFGGNYVDATPPSISYTALGNAPPALNRSFTGVTITDASGVNTASGTRPRVYYKKFVDANTIADNTPFTDGWKHVEANGTTSPFDFTIDYALLFGGSVSVGDVIQYFVVAQDLAATPNVGINSGTFNTTPTSVALVAGNTPITGTINQYNISGTYAGTYTVGTNLGNNYSSLTGAGGLFEALNAGVITGNITARITTSLSEDGTNDLNAINYDVAGANYTIRIVPDDATEKLVLGAVANGMIRFDGNDYVTIDGNNGLDASGTKYLRFRNTDLLNPTFLFTNESRRNTITNCIIEGSSTISAVSNAAGVINFGTTTGADGNDSNTVSDCDVRDRSDVAGLPANLIVCNGSSGTTAQMNDYITITGCNLYNFYLDGASARSGAIVLWGGANNWTVSNNSIYQEATRTFTGAAIVHPIWNNNSGHNNFTVTGNFIGGSSPNCGGSPMTMTSATAGVVFWGMRLFMGSTVATSVQGNTIRNISFTTNLTASNTQTFAGIICSQTAGLVNIGNVTGNTIGSTTGNGDITVTINGTGAFGSNTTAIYQLGYGATQNNNIGSITLNGAATITGTATFSGITHTGTSPIALNVTDNTIGSTTTSGSMQNGTATLPCDFAGIRISSGTTGQVTINANTVANFTDASTVAASVVKGIWFSGTSTTAVLLTNNSVNNLSTSSINVAGLTGSSTAPCIVGIQTSSASANHDVSGNTVNALRSTTTAASATVVKGIAIMANAPTSTISKNKIYDLTNTSTAATPGLIGIFTYFGSYTCSNNMVTITNGEISDAWHNSNNSSNDKIQINQDTKALRDNSTTKNSTNDNVTKQDVTNDGITKNNSTNNTIQIKRFGVNDNHVNVVIPPVVTYNPGGKQTNQQDINTVYEPVVEKQAEEKPAQYRQITETDASTNGVLIQGIHDEAGPGVWNYYYNSVYVGGSATTGTNYSTCYSREISTTVVTMRNNLFVNARTGTGTHFAVRSTITGSWTANYNAFIVPNGTAVGFWSATGYDMAGWRTNSTGDKQSWQTTTTDMNPGNLFTNISTGDLHLLTNNDVWLVYGKGIAVTGQSTDYDGNARSTTIAGGCTDIGADEVTASVTELPPLPVQDIAPGSGVTSTYSRWSRVFCVIDWGTGGSSYPTDMNIRYYSGRNPNNVTGGNYANSYMTVSSVGTLTDAAYDVTIYFGDNETGTINTPATNTVLAKYNSSWEVFPPGVNPWQTQLTYNTGTGVFTTKVTGLWDFSDFALSDNTSPLPVVISEFAVGVSNRDANLRWITSHELNNKGFGVERRIKLTGEKDNYTQWKEVAFINGSGTTNEPKTYTFSDKKLNSGIYQYRLKQVDYNGNFEYFNPSQSDVAIGKPGTFDLSQNYPNPSNPKSKIDFQMPFDGKVTIRVYDILGQEVKTLVDEFKSADFYTVEFDGSGIASGTYFYRIIAEGNGEKFTKTLKMIIVK